MNFAPLVPHELEVQVSPVRKEAGVPVALGTEYVSEVKEGEEREREGRGGRAGGKEREKGWVDMDQAGRTVWPLPSFMLSGPDHGTW